MKPLRFPFRPALPAAERFADHGVLTDVRGRR
jgi:hypothetical protein